MPLNTRESSDHENKNIDLTMRFLPADNNRYSIEHEEGLNTFKILEDPQQISQTNLKYRKK